MRDYSMNTIFLGNYWQTNNKKKEPVEWIVLREDEDKIYVISKYCLDCAPYYDGHHLAWKNSHLREWLNGYFLTEAFSTEEHDQILLSKIKTSREFHFLDEGIVTPDKIFLPSIAEAHIYFGTAGLYDILLKEKRIARPTDYAIMQGCWASSLKFDPVKDSVLRDCLLRDAALTDGAIDAHVSCWQTTDDPLTKEGALGKDTVKKRYAASWYLRSPGSQVIYIDPDGSTRLVDRKYIGSYEQHIGVRPAMWVKK